MATKITRDIIESSLNCKYKGHLKLTEQQGTSPDNAPCVGKESLAHYLSYVTPTV